MANKEEELIKKFLYRLKNAVDQNNDRIRRFIQAINIIPESSSIVRLQRFIIDILDPIIHSGDGSNDLQVFKHLMLDILNQALNVLHFINKRKMIGCLIINNTRHRNASEYLQYCRQSAINAIKCLNSVNFTDFNITTNNVIAQHFKIKKAFTYAMIKVPMLFENIELASERHRQNRKEFLSFIEAIATATTATTTITTIATTTTTNTATKIEIFFKCTTSRRSCSKGYWRQHIASFLSDGYPITEG